MKQSSPQYANDCAVEGDDNAVTSLARFRQIAGAIIAVILLLGLIHFLTPSTSGLLQRVLIDLGHVPIFAFIAYALLKLMHSSHPEMTRFPGLWDHLYAGLGVLLLAAVSEAAQMTSPGRSASVADMLRDCAGGALALSVSAAFSRSPESRQQSHSRTAYLAIAFVLFAVLLAPTAWVTAALMRKNTSWPTIVGSSYRLESVFAVAYQSNLRVVSVPAEWRVDKRENAFHVQLSTSGDSGVLLQEVDRDWGEYKQACVDITNPDSRPLRALIKFGNHPMFFRSTSFREIPLSIGSRARAIRCESLHRLYTKLPLEGDAAPARFRSLALLTNESNEVCAFLLHRIWLQ